MGPTVSKDSLKNKLGKIKLAKTGFIVILSQSDLYNQDNRFGDQFRLLPMLEVVENVQLAVLFVFRHEKALVRGVGHHYYCQAAVVSKIHRADCKSQNYKRNKTLVHN